MWLTPWIDAASELVLGARCACCARPGRAICDHCRQLLRAEVPLAVTLDPPLRVVSAGQYRDRLREVLLTAKERAGLTAVPLLSERLAIAVAELATCAPHPAPLIVVPVPSTRSVQAQRGVDFTTALARGATRRLRTAGIEAMVWPGLRQVRRRADQAGLGRQARQENLRHTMRVTRAAPPGWVVVVDDVVTTGATLMEARRACLRAQIDILGAATVAATPKRTNKGAQRPASATDGNPQMASGPLSPVRTRTTLSTGTIHTLPSPT